VVDEVVLRTQVVAAEVASPAAEPVVVALTVVAVGEAAVTRVL
jgi:hypothetical protein